jgi:Bacterial dnaA protein helix-turn-helix
MQLSLEPQPAHATRIPSERPDLDRRNQLVLENVWLVQFLTLQTNSRVAAAQTFEGGEHDALRGRVSSVGLALEPSPSPANDRGRPGPYARYAEVFSRVYGDTGSIEIALEVIDAFRTREAVLPPVIADVPTLVVRVVAQLFSVKPKLLFVRNRHRDVTSARYVASWLLFRRRWSKSKIASFFHLDHSTVIHGLRLVATDTALLVAAHKAEQFLALESDGSGVER